MRKLFIPFKNFWPAFNDPEFIELMLFVIILLASGTIFYHKIEGWRILDSLYFSITTLSTVGYGDMAPQTDAGKLFTIIYIITGVGTILGFVSVVAEHARKKSPLDNLFRRKNS